MVRGAAPAAGLEREPGEAVGVVVAVRAGQVAGEDVARVERHEADVALVGVAGGQRLDVRGEPEALAEPGWVPRRPD